MINECSDLLNKLESEEVKKPEKSGNKNSLMKLAETLKFLADLKGKMFFIFKICN
jgi:hypothetical protein